MVRSDTIRELGEKQLSYGVYVYAYRFNSFSVGLASIPWSLLAFAMRSLPIAF